MRRFAKMMTFAALVAVIATGAVFAGGEQEEGEQKSARLAYVNWAEGVAYTHVAQVVLEDKMGYDVTITAADAAPAYTSVAQGDNDVFMETWPVLHADYLDKYSETLYDVGKIYEGTQVGLVVPQYMVEDGVETISDLKEPEVMDRLNAEITGIDSGAGMMQDIENEVMPGYGLNEAGYTLVASSGPAMTSALKKAVENDEYIVVAGWKPHWKFGVWDLAFLKQDGPQVWSTGNIHLYGNSKLPEMKPELAQFLENMYFTDAEMGSLLVAYKNADDPYEMAKAWVEENPSVWEDWIP
jgi:glycine betaine/proline transport system substrate-binding protein